MARKKVNLAWIANDSIRRATLKKRRNGLVKKVSELSTLCDVKACLVVYGPQESLPVVWPSVHEATRLVARFRSMPEMEQFKKMMNQQGFLRQRVVKLQDQLRKHQRENREIETTLLMYEGLAGRSLHNVGMNEVTRLAWMLEMRMKMVQQRIEMLTAQMAEPLSHVLPAATLMEEPMPVMEMLRAQMAEPSSQVIEMAGEQRAEASSQVVPPVAPMPVMEMVGVQMASQSPEASSQVVPAVPLVQGPTPVMKEKTPMEAAMEALQTPNWFGDVMNPNGNMIYGGGQEMVQPYVDITKQWLHPYYFPFN